MKSTIIKFGLLAIATLILIELSKYSLLTRNIQTEITVGLIAVVFAAFGIYISRFLFNKPPKSTEIYNSDKLKSLGISTRELDVLKAVANGRSNKEIAEKLFISESTVKTHVSNLLSKLDAKRRTEAIVKAREIGLITSYKSTNDKNHTLV